MNLVEDPNFRSRVKMFKKARLDSAIDVAIYANAEALAESARNITNDLLTQHTLVSPEQAAELRAHFNLGKEE